MNALFDNHTIPNYSMRMYDVQNHQFPQSQITLGLVSATGAINNSNISVTTTAGSQRYAPANLYADLSTATGGTATVIIKY